MEINFFLRALPVFFNEKIGGRPDLPFYRTCKIGERSESFTSSKKLLVLKLEFFKETIKII